MVKVATHHIGETRTMNCGMKAKIIAYRKYIDIDVQFEDDTITTNKEYKAFKNGQIGYPAKHIDKTRTKRHITCPINHIGETRIINCGIRATIIDYHNAHNVDVQFEDGTIIKNKQYYGFKNGKIKCPTNHIGEVCTMTCGMSATIITYRRYKDIDVRFEDGTIVKNIRYHEFKRGVIGNPNKPYNRKTALTNRLGERRCMNNGMIAEIIAYRSSTDIDVRFEDSTIIKNRKYTEFKKGIIASTRILYHRIGEKNRMNCGMIATIIAYRRFMDIDVKFEDGTITKNKSYANFKKGVIANKNLITNHIGEKNHMTNGMVAEIIAYRGSRDIDVRFEDGTVVTNRDYRSFKTGQIAITRILHHRVGEKKHMNNGMVTEIINYRSCNDIDVKFQDGTILKNRTYNNFKRGTMITTQLLYTRIGEKNCMNNGLIATIIAYRSANDIDIEFENGTIIENKSYNSFERGKIASQTTTPIAKRIGEKQRMNNGMIAKIIEYRSVNDIDVEFEDGTVVKNRQYHSFKRGGIAISRVLHNRINEKSLMHNGLTAEIVTYHRATDIDVRFEDGTIVKNKYYYGFQHGTITHPTLNAYSQKGTLFNIQITGIAYQLQQSPDDKFPTTYFNYIHPNTKEHCIGIISDIHQLALNYKLIPEPQLLVFE